MLTAAAGLATAPPSPTSPTFSCRVAGLLKGPGSNCHLGQILLLLKLTLLLWAFSNRLYYFQRKPLTNGNAQLLHFTPSSPLTVILLTMPMLPWCRTNAGRGHSGDTGLPRPCEGKAGCAWERGGRPAPLRVPAPARCCSAQAGPLFSERALEREEAAPCSQERAPCRPVSHIWIKAPFGFYFVNRARSCLNLISIDTSLCSEFSENLEESCVSVFLL